MAITAIHSFLVHPSKHVEEPPPVGGTRVSKSKAPRLFSMLEDIYEKSDAECSIDISFNRAADGSQNNECRNLILDYVQERRMDNGRVIATRLQSVTTNKSGLGLLFLMVGDEARKEAKLVISRFPADSAILAEQKEGELTVQFLERVFMKSATAYKAVVYRGAMGSTAFWTGKAVDKQINLGVAPTSNYWIRDFLGSDFRTTSAAGTRRLADALRTATSTAANLAVRSEIVAAVRLVRGMDGQTTSITSFLDRFGLSDEAKGVVCAHIPEHLLTEHFRLDADEFEHHLPIRSVELDNGGLMMAPTASFDEVFKRQNVAGERMRFVAEGVVVDDKLRKGRR